MVRVQGTVGDVSPRSWRAAGAALRTLVIIRITRRSTRSGGRGLLGCFALLEHFNQSSEVIGYRSIDEVAIMGLQKLADYGRHRPHGVCSCSVGRTGLFCRIGWDAAGSTFIRLRTHELWTVPLGRRLFGRRLCQTPKRSSIAVCSNGTYF